jgi:hypothetical protein
VHVVQGDYDDVSGHQSTRCLSFSLSTSSTTIDPTLSPLSHRRPFPNQNRRHSRPPMRTHRRLGLSKLSCQTNGRRRPRLGTHTYVRTNPLSSPSAFLLTYFFHKDSKPLNTTTISS